MRIRSIKPSFWRSDDITALPMDVRLLYVGLWSYVDDNGVGLDDYRQIAADLFALEDDQTAVREFVRDGLATLSRGLLVVRYRVEDRSYVFIPKWDLHQKVDRPAKARYPRPSGDADPPTREDEEVSRMPRDTLATPSPRARVAGEGEKGRRGEGEHKKTPSSCGPRSARGTRIPDDFVVTDEMVEWAREHTPHVDGRFETEQFIDYWHSKAGKDATKLDWTRTWQTWLRRAEKESARHSQQQYRTSTTDQRVQAGLELAAELRTEAEQRAIAALEPSSPPDLRVVGGQP